MRLAPRRLAWVVERWAAEFEARAELALGAEARADLRDCLRLAIEDANRIEPGHQRVLELAERFRRFASADLVAALPDLAPGHVRVRLSMLVRAGLVRKTGRRRPATYEIAEDG